MDYIDWSEKIITELTEQYGVPEKYAEMIVEKTYNMGYNDGLKESIDSADYDEFAEDIDFDDEEDF